MLLVAHPSFPASNFAEFLAYVRANPGKVTFASGGIGSSPHMTSELLNMSLDLKSVHVPYRGEQPALADVMGNQVGVLFANIPAARAVCPGRQTQGPRHDRRGPLAARSRRPHDRRGPAPTDIVTAAWNGLYGPAGMAPDLVQKAYTDATPGVGPGSGARTLAGLGERHGAEHAEAVPGVSAGRGDALPGKVIRAANIRASDGDGDRQGSTKIGY